MAFSYLSEKTNLFLNVMNAYMQNEIHGICLFAKNPNQEYNLYCIVFLDEMKHRRALWCPARIFEKTDLFPKFKEGKYILLQVSSFWHSSPHKIEDMIFSGIFCYSPQIWAKTHKSYKDKANEDFLKNSSPKNK